MRLLTAIGLSASAFSALILAIPAPERAAFTSTGSPEQGFKIPKRTLPGIYKVTFDDEGVAHHVKLRDMPTDVSRRTVDSRDAVNETIALRERDTTLDIVCTGEELDSESVDIVVRRMYQACGPGDSIAPDVHLYAIDGQVVAFDCNFSADWIFCGDYRYEYIFQEEIPGKCGRRNAGWAQYSDPAHSVGMHNWLPEEQRPWSPDGGAYFCGRDHDAYIDVNGPT